MSREEIIRMAREVGIEFDPGWGTCFTGNVQLERFAALVAAAEREACAKICSDLAEHRDLGSYGMLVAHTCANDILARGQK